MTWNFEVGNTRHKFNFRNIRDFNQIDLKQHLNHMGIEIKKTTKASQTANHITMHLPNENPLYPTFKGTPQTDKQEKLRSK